MVQPAREAVVPCREEIVRVGEGGEYADEGREEGGERRFGKDEEGREEVRWEAVREGQDRVEEAEVVQGRDQLMRLVADEMQCIVSTWRVSGRRMRARTDQSASTRAKGPDGSVLNRPPEIRHAKTRTARSRTVDMAKIITRKLCKKRASALGLANKEKGQRSWRH